MKSKKIFIAGSSFLALFLAIGLISNTLQAHDAQDGKPSFWRGKIGNSERHEAMKEVFENGDYQGWLELMEGKPGIDKFSEEDFAKFAEIHQLMEEGNFEEAMEMKKELGLGWRMMGRGKGFRHGFKKGFAFGQKDD